MNTPNLPAWTVVGLYSDYRDYDKVLAATFVAHGYGRSALEGKWDALNRLVASQPNHLTNPEDFDADYDPREELIVLAVFPGALQDHNVTGAVADKFIQVLDAAHGVTLFKPHTTPQIEENLAAAFADAEADFLAQYEATTCPYCGEETALITPTGRVVCSCWTNPAQEIVDDLQQDADVPQWEFFHEENLPGDWPEELGVHLGKGADGVEVRVISYPDSLSIEFLDPEGTPYEAEVLVAAARDGRIAIQIQSADERISITEGDHR
jgi:hypothetical protein